MTAVSRTVSIPATFNGPLHSGNGGYCAGTFAALLAEDAAEVSLRSPVPLGVPLSIREQAAAAEPRGGICAMHGETLIAEARPAPDFALRAPEPVGIREARLAMGRYRGASSGIFSECFVCGRTRGDSLGVFAGPVAGRRLVACTFSLPAWTAGPGGAVRSAIVWAVLDCPSYFGAYVDVDPAPVALLARQRTRLLQPARAGEEHVLIAWPHQESGRKRVAGSALFSASGELLAVSETLFVEPRSEPAQMPSASPATQR